MDVSITSRCHFAWGRRGALQAAQDGHMLVVVDTLSFSTATATAVHYGGEIYPCSVDTDVFNLAQAIDGEAAVNRREVPTRGRFSLSPLTFRSIEPGTCVVLASPNGATCSQYAQHVPYLFVGALVNARAVAGAVAHILATSNLHVTVLACGERWLTPSEDGTLRFAVEDYLGAGAIISYIQESKTSEARICEGAFQAAAADLPALIWECESGLELRTKGFAQDVEAAMQIDNYDTAPFMLAGRITRFDPAMLLGR